MIILGIDLGQARTGVAICDRDEILASPVGMIQERNMERLVQKIHLLVQERHVQRIVVGLPLNMDGTEGESAARARAFARQLEETSGLSVILSDERRTTVAAHGYLNETNVRGAKRKQLVDAVSAVIILEDHLRKRKNEG